MHRHLVIVVGVIALGVTAGCPRRAATPPAPSNVPAASSRPSAPKPSAEMKEVKQPETMKPAVVEKPKPKPKPVEAAKDDAKKKASIAVKKSERMAILAPGGPIAVDVFVTIDGRPHAEAFEEVVRQVLAAADTDKDGRPTWKELAANKEYLASQQQRMSPGGAAELKMWEQYDRNRDGKIQPDEAAAWLGRDAGMSARSFDVRGSRAYSSVPSASSRIWRLLDVDGNGRLSKAELAQAAAKLLPLDENDDAIVTTEELLPLTEQLRIDRDQRSTAGNATNAYAAIYLEPQYELNRLDYLLGDLYGRGQVLRPESFTAFSEIYKKLDTDGDDQLIQKELAAMQTMSAQLKLAVDFRPADAKRTTSIKVLEHVPEIEVVGQPAADRVILKLGTTRILVSAIDRTAGQNPAYAMTGSQIHMMVHDQCDELGEVMDADADGRLGEREIATCAERLMKFDANGDGQITNDELPYTMIAAIVRGERPGEQSLFRPVNVSTSEALADVPSWFASADSNGDGDVSRREFLGMNEQFSSLDKNRDGFISADEAANPAPTTSH